MTINKKQEGDKLIIALEGDLNTLSAPDFEAALKPLDAIQDIEIDMSRLNYISSAGLRVLLVVYTEMNEKGGTLVVLSPNEEIREIFNVTSFSSFLTIR